ncbi:MAG: metal-dependent hydrolase [Nanoarchaeota archaeon]|nr:metal-dependent hydrolase [Nanoarchaeota archaeon]
MTDNLTHSLFALFIGIILIHYLKIKGKKRLPYIAILIAGNIPDIDFIIRFFGAGFYFVNHRVLSHSIIGLIIFTIMITFIFSYILKQKQYFKYLILCLVGIVAHLFLDAITSFGTELMYPINNIRYAWNLIPVVDIFVLIIFFIGIWFLKIQPKNRVKIAKATLFIFFIFIFFKVGLHTQAAHAVSELEESANFEVIPHFLNPFGWRVVITNPDSYLISDFDLTIGGFKKFHYFPISEKEKVEASKNSFFARQFLEFAKVPYPLVENNTITWMDLRMTTDKVEWITVEVKLDENLNIIKENFLG